MSARPWVKLQAKEPPISTAVRRYWLELWIPERIQGDDLEAKRKGLALGLYCGDGHFRLQGDPNQTIETISSWRPLAGSAAPVMS